MKPRVWTEHPQETSNPIFQPLELIFEIFRQFFITIVEREFDKGEKKQKIWEFLSLLKKIIKIQK